MAWTGTRKLILPAALSVTSFAAASVIVACGGDDEGSGKTSSQVVACADAPSGACEKCKDDQGKVTCGPAKDCYPTNAGTCEPGSSG
jgi:hypothetical protein